MSATVAELRAVQVARGGRALLDGVDLTLHAGEVLAVLGPNGAGKSTLLGVLAGDLHPDSGEVLIDDRPLSDWRVGDLSRRRGVLLQENSTAFPFVVHEVVRMGRAPWRRTPRSEEDDEAVSEAISAADIGPLAERAVPTLSGGERARTAFARVIAGRTGMLLLDEPTAALDLGHQEALLSLARAHARSGDAVLVILHDLNLAAAFADRVLLLQEGRVAACGTPAEVLTETTVSTVYRTPVEVIPHPVTGRGIILPRRPM
ncbi:MAG: heme ABC transporter ATP-binding protein [Microbacterium sp.]|jgi:iron complex transport system ATP-binding protein|uniref:heme ABC transporter ATP-binding protein n=1 Tax=Microbacterium sp. TaxID=51671 RepID=UPI002817AE2F|nr:heme ABC transporter ATP-binding protein [Microbacterium sp.]MDR2321581.1 heme ABC transporter ATP-binding protein [Microbacterium sp.]